MIDEYQLLELAGRFRDARQLERDYLLTLLLHEISSVFSNDLVFKGGTALKYFYNLNRFSEDIDFSFTGSNKAQDRKESMQKMDRALHNVEVQYQIVEKEHRASKHDGEIDGVNYEIRIRGPLNRRSSQLQNINIDISTRNDLLLKPELKYLSPIYQDIGTFSLPVMEINEILAEKIAAIMERARMRDIYDVYYLLKIKGLMYDEKLVVEKMTKRKEHFEKEELAKKISGAKDKMRWKSELAYLVDPLPDNAEVVSQLEMSLKI
jgi:hypothetical protein